MMLIAKLLYHVGISSWGWDLCECVFLVCLLLSWIMSS